MLLAAPGAPWLVSGCSIDARALYTSGRAGEVGARAGDGSPPGVGGTGAASGADAVAVPMGTGLDAGQAGEAQGGAAAFADGCVDLDNDGVSDCRESLLENSAFKTDVGHWIAEPGVTIEWDAQDLLGARDSGSAFVTSSGSLDAPGDGIAAVTQCVPVSAGQVMEVAASALIDEGPTRGRAVMILWFFSSAACGVAPEEVYKTPEEFEQGKQLTLRGAKAVDRTGSMLVRLGVIKPFTVDSFSVRFDNVLIRAL
jgi:hypothetical protein